MPPVLVAAPALLAVDAPSWASTDRLLTVLAVAGIVLPLVLLLVAWKAVRLVARVLVIVLAVGVGALFWRERSDLVDCVELVKATAEVAGPVEGRCQVFGVDVPVPGATS